MYENILVYENKIRKKIRATFLTDFCLRQPRYFFVLSRQSSNVYLFMVTSRKWRAAAVLTAVLVKEKSGEKDAEQVAAVILRRRRVRRRLFSRLLTKTRKERKTSMFQHKKKRSRPTCLKLYRRAIFDELSGSRLRRRQELPLSGGNGNPMSGYEANERCAADHATNVGKYQNGTSYTRVSARHK